MNLSSLRGKVFKKVTTLVVVLFFIGCQEEPTNIILPTQNLSFMPNETKEPLEYLNQMRVMSGMIPFSYNETLANAAKNHAYYSTLHNHQGHDQDKAKSSFTGNSPSQRAFYVGYNSHVLENISYNKNIIDSIDSLFTAIYHRFGFLNFSVNEVGFAQEENQELKASVFVMGNSFLNDVCSQGGDSGYGRFYTQVCKDKNTKVSQRNYENTQNFINAKIVPFPHENATDVSVYFSGEIPDPMPTCKITANPISIQFKPSQSKITLLSFKVYDENNKELEAKIITKENDINAKFSEFEFALFPLKVYKFNTTYKAVFEYKENEEVKKYQWSFTTKSPQNPYFVVSGEENLSLEADREYDIFFMPKHCNDMFQNYNTKYPSYATIKTKQKGVNFFSINFSGTKGDKATITMSDERTINLYLSSTSLHHQEKSKKHFLIGGLILLIAIFVGIFRRR